MNIDALSVLQWMDVAASAAAAVAAGRFVVHYWRAKWRRSEMGQLVMLMAVTLAALFLLTVGISLGITSGSLLADALRMVRIMLVCVFTGLMTWQDRIRGREVRQGSADGPRRDDPPTD